MDTIQKLEIVAANISPFGNAWDNRDAHSKGLTTHPFAL